MRKNMVAGKNTMGQGEVYMDQDAGACSGERAATFEGDRAGRGRKSWENGYQLRNVGSETPGTVTDEKEAGKGIYGEGRRKVIYVYGRIYQKL